MKKLLAILFAVLLAFSCFTVAMVSAEAAPLVQSGSDFNNWSKFAHSKGYEGTPYTINGEVATITADLRKVALNSPVFELVPGKKYELSLALRVNSNSIGWVQSGYTLYPTFALHEVGDQYNVGDALVENEAHTPGANDYAYSYSGAKVIRPDFTATWQVEGLESVERPGWSFVDWTGDACFGNILPAGANTFEENFSKDAWKTVTCTFTAIADEEGETAQKVSLGLGFSVGAAFIKGMAFDVKDVEVNEVTEGSSDDSSEDESEDESDPSEGLLNSDFADSTKWMGTADGVLAVNDGYATITGAKGSAIGIMSSSFPVTAGKNYELTFSLRIPQDSASYNIGGNVFAPSLLLYKQTTDADGKLTLPIISATKEQNNMYSYTVDDGSWVIGEGFKSIWTVGNYAPIEVTDLSGFHWKHYAGMLAQSGDNDLKVAASDWITYKGVFNGVGEGTENVAFAMVFAGHGNPAGLKFDIKDVSVKELASCDHSTTELVGAVDATCTEDGYTGDTVCSLCDTVLEEGTVIVSEGHKLTKVDAVEATHDAAGNKEYFTCSVCNKLFSDAEGKTEIAAADVVIAKGEHVYGDFVTDAQNHWKECECGSKSENSAHVFSDWKVTKEATATEKGSRERECAFCDYKAVEELPALGGADVDNKEEVEDKEEVETDKDKVETDKEESASPETGDSTNVAFWFALLMVSALAVVTTVAAKKVSAK